MPSLLRLALSALAASLPLCDALVTRTNSAIDTTWTVTSYIAYEATTTTATYGYGGTRTRTYTDTYTQARSLKKGVTPTATPLSSTTRTRSYGSLEIVMMYVDGAHVPTSDLEPTPDVTATDYYQTYGRAYTSWVLEVVWTAPSSCPAAFTVATHQRITDVPTEVLEQRTDFSTTTSISTAYDGDKYTVVTAYVPSSAYPQLTAVPSTDDYTYSYYVRRCTNPTATGTARYPSATRGVNTSGSNGDYDDQSWWYYGSPLMTWAIVIAAVLPSIFLLGFFENYFWFRRMMIGKSTLRFGTTCWILLLWPLIFATRRCPERDAATQKTLHEQWKKVGFGTALALWFRWGFRHRYPVDLLGVHPEYHNPDPNGSAAGPMTGAPSGGFLFYVQGPPGPDGAPTFQPVMVPANQLPEGLKLPQQAPVAVPQNGAGPATGAAQPHPQAPQPAYMTPATANQQTEPAAPALPPRSPPPMVPSPLSDAPRKPTGPPPPVPSAGEERGESSRAAGSAGDHDGPSVPPPAK